MQVLRAGKESQALIVFNHPLDSPQEEQAIAKDKFQVQIIPLKSIPGQSEHTDSQIDSFSQKDLSEILKAAVALNLSKKGSKTNDISLDFRLTILPRIDSKFNKDKRLEPVPEVPEPDNKASSDNFANTQPTP